MDLLGGVDILWTKTFGDEFDDRGYDIAAFFQEKNALIINGLYLYHTKCLLFLSDDNLCKNCRATISNNSNCFH